MSSKKTRVIKHGSEKSVKIHETNIKIVKKLPNKL